MVIMKKIRRCTVHQKFFDRWSPDMAYILGFFCADGYMSINPRGSRYIAFHITDRDLLVKIRDRLGAGHKLSLRDRGNPKWKKSWRIQIGSRTIFERFLALGIVPHKAERIRAPQVPIKYQADFVRGYFDGDGGVWCGLIHKNDRKNPSQALSTYFTSGSKGILEDVAAMLEVSSATSPRKPIYRNRAFRMQYSTSDSRKIYRFMYGHKTDLYLERKKVIFERYLGT